MRDDYKMNAMTGKLSTEIEVELLETLSAMAKHTQLSMAELTNTALKRFISGHKDFLPPGYAPPRLEQPRKVG